MNRMIHIGVINKVVSGNEAEQHLQMAKDLCETCYQMYATSPTGIGAEYVNFNPTMSIGAPEYHLRPYVIIICSFHSLLCSLSSLHVISLID
jgi:hypothetical protein